MARAHLGFRPPAQREGRMRSASLADGGWARLGAAVPRSGRNGGAGAGDGYSCRPWLGRGGETLGGADGAPPAAGAPEGGAAVGALEPAGEAGAPPTAVGPSPEGARAGW